MEYVPYVSAAERRRRLVSKPNADPLPEVEVASHTVSLVEQTLELKEQNPDFEKDQRKRDEGAFLDAVTAKQTSLLSAEERAKGQRYTESIDTGWRPRKRVRHATTESIAKIRKEFHIIIEGDDVPPAITSFKDMKIPRVLRTALRDKGIARPTPIQVQGLPVALCGRDMVGIAFTGSGKTMTFTIPMLLMALGEEMKCKLRGRDGPIGLIMGPSRELMTQTFELVEMMCEALLKDKRFPKLRCTLAIGGQDKRSQVLAYRQNGTHMVIATPGRLNDMLSRGDMNLDICRYFCLDEGDRMMDDGFDEEVQKTLGYFKLQRQTLLFSATMPKKFVEFAQKSLIRPIMVNVGRAGAANLDVVQHVELVKQESKIVYLLECLQKSPPPVIIFAENKADVDRIVEYLLVKGVDAVGIHAGKSQNERNDAIKNFKSHSKDILVATDIAAKGLDFPDIQHVINFDMPTEIENYVHRIGRTGRNGKTGIATTFINANVDATILLDLKHLLVEARQKIPPMLMQLDDPTAGEEGDSSCAYCGGPGHRITNCPKLKGNVRGQANSRDIIGNAAYGGNC